jgi:PAS domain S-box-containing protein
MLPRLRTVWFDVALGAERDRAILGISLTIVVMALVVLVGWHAHFPPAVHLFYGSVPMQYNTALCFLALGVAGLGLASRRRLLLLGGGSFAALMGGAVILEFATGTSFGIDALFFYPWERTLSADAGRTALTTAISFFLFGIALVMRAVRPRAHALAGIAGSIPVGLALTSIIGYLFQITYFLPFGLGRPMSLHTSLALLAYGIAMLGHAWTSAERGPDGLPHWGAGIGGALLPVSLVGASALFGGQSWRVVVLEAVLSIAGVALITLTIHKLTTVKVAFKGLLMTGVPLILLLMFVGLVVHVKRQSELAAEWALHSAEVLGVSQALMAHSLEAESAVRGYVITGDETYAGAYQESWAQLTVTITQLQQLVRDNPPQEAHARNIAQLMVQREQRFTELLRLIKRGNKTPAQEDIKGPSGPALMKDVRTEIRAFSQEEERISAERRHVLDASWQRLSWLLVAGTAAAILLASILTLSFSGGTSRRLQQLRDNAMSLAAGRELAPRLAGHDEIAELDRVFHQMALSLDEFTRREKAVLEAATDGIVIKDLDHRYVMVNQGSATLIGKTVDEVVGASIFDIYEPDTAQRIFEFDNEILGGAATTTHEFMAASKGREPRTYSSTYGPYRDLHGHLVGVISISRDITEQKQAERALIESERRFRELFYDAPVGYHELDTGGRITCVNTTELLMLGYSSEEMIGRPFWEFLEEPDAAHRMFADRLAGIAPLRSVEGSFRRADGTFLAVQVDVRMLEDSSGRIVGTRATMQDITERKRAEALLKTGALQSAIFNSANFSSIATDANGVIQIFNVGAERMLGYAAADVMNKITPAAISDPQEVIARATALSVELGTPITPGFEALVFKASRGIEDIYELTYIRKDGSRLPAVVSVTALRDAQDAIIGYLLIGTDNTARQQVEEERMKLDQRLRDQHFYTRSLIESNIDALMTTDPRGIVTDVNKQMEALTGCTRDELIGAPFKTYFTDPARAEAGIRRVLAEGTLTNYELTARARDGKETVVSYNATTFHDRDRSLQGVFAAARDVTELKAYEHTLQQKNVELEDASRMKSEFLANMSHELRTPLNAIIGFSEVLRDGLMGEMTEKQRGFIGDIFGSGKHLLSLINDILDLSKVEAGKMTLELEPMPVSSLFVNSLSIIREKASTRHIRLDLDHTVAEASGSIRADPRKVKQILYNLLSNAVKFTDEGGQVTLRASHVLRGDVGRFSDSATGLSFPLPDSAFTEFLEISVADSGIGISPEALDRLFKPFSQVDSGLARRFEGTGLGLVMVKALVELHGGTVAVESAVGAGSCFTVWLPLRAADEAALVQTRESIAPRVDTHGAVRTALVVEDDLKSAELIRMQLEAEGFTVLHAVSAEVALALVVQQPVSLITLDIMLPHMDGWEFLNRVKQLPDLRSIPVLIISIVADSAKGFALGAAAVMQKPTSRQELYEALVDLGLLPLSKDRTLTVLVVDDDPSAVELIAVRLLGVATTILRAYGGREAIETAQQELPDLIVLDLMMPEVSGFDVVNALHAGLDTARIPILAITAKQITEEDRTTLNGFVTTIMDKAEFDHHRFTTEVRRAMSGRPLAA